MTVNAYLGFPGTCREAFEFYAKVLGGEIIMMMTAGDAPPDSGTSPEWKDKIMHARISVPGGLLYGSDAPPQFYSKPEGFHVCIAVEDAAKGKAIFDALADGGQVQMPYEKTFWAEAFGMVVDRFGTPWMINAGMM